MRIIILKVFGIFLAKCGGSCQGQENPPPPPISHFASKVHNTSPPHMNGIDSQISRISTVHARIEATNLHSPNFY